MPPDPAKSDFESVVSTLIWNMTAWPGGQLDRSVDNANYTCQSTANSVGAGVSSTTYFRVECKFLSFDIKMFKNSLYTCYIIIVPFCSLSLCSCFMFSICHTAQKIVLYV